MGKRRSGQRGSLAAAVRRQELSRVTGRLSFLRSQWLYRVYSVVPARFRWLLPLLQDYLPGIDPAGAEPIATAEPAIADLEQPLPLLTDTFLLPPLAPGTELLGQRGRYRIESLVGVRGRGRLYRGRQLGTDQPVSIREYGLPPRQFSPSEIRQRQTSFRDRGGLALADGRPERFRLVPPHDVIPDQAAPRCYLVGLSGLDLLPTLRTHLRTQQPWTAPQVWRFFNQVLQTLESLHGQKFTIPAGQVRQGIVHGNLSLDSLLIDWPHDPALAGDPPFLIYVTDLLLWEGLFEPPTQEPRSPLVAEDLAAVGRVGFRLLTGQPDDTLAGNPLEPAAWPNVPRPLRQFAFQLLGLETPFPSAAAARQAIPHHWQVPGVSLPETSAIAPRESPQRHWWRWLVAVLLLGLLGGALGWWLTRRQLAVASPVSSPQLCCFDAATGMPRGDFAYTSDRDSTGTYIFRQKNLVFPAATVESAVTSVYPAVQLSFTPAATDEDAVFRVLQEEADFALSVLFGSSEQAVLPLPPQVQSTPIAHDAIAVFVAFSYEQRAQGLPQALNGRLTLAQLRQLYTGQITNWRELGGPNLPVQLYVPAEPDIVAIFEQRVLQDPTAIANFRRLWAEPTAFERPPASEQTPTQVMRTFASLRAVIRDFEGAAIGSIGFGPMSQVFGQCAVYPLAIQSDTGAFVQAIVRDQSGRAIDPTIDLCQDKGSYRRDHHAILTGQYPLSYPLEIIYPYDNSRPPIGRKVAEILQSQESQQALARAGLVVMPAATEKR